MKTLILLSLTLAFLSGCASKQAPADGLVLLSQSDYEKIIDDASRTSKQYAGLYNTLDMTATIVTTKVAQAQLEQSARIYKWEKAKFQLEKNKSDEKLKNQTTVFLSFFTPEPKNNDLHKPKTVWKVFLDADGNRYEGKVTKLTDSAAEIWGLYPYYQKFATPYSVTFPVSTLSTEKSPAKFLITGPLDSATMEFGN